MLSMFAYLFWLLIMVVFYLFNKVGQFLFTIITIIIPAIPFIMAYSVRYMPRFVNSSKKNVLILSIEAKMPPKLRGIIFLKPKEDDIFSYPLFGNEDHPFLDWEYCLAYFRATLKNIWIRVWRDSWNIALVQLELDESENVKILGIALLNNLFIPSLMEQTVYELTDDGVRKQNSILCYFIDESDEFYFII